MENTAKRMASTAARQKAREIKSLLEISPEAIPTLAALETKFSLSRNYLQTGFRELYGTTIGGFARDVKLKHIKEQLKDYTLTLDTIALQTGYNGGEALCRFFKMMEGVSPGQWRRNYLNSIS